MASEIVDIVDEDDKVIGKATREESDKKMLRRRIAVVIIFNNNGEVLLQKRSKTKVVDPEFWDFGVGETLMSGESYEAVAIRGLKEELSITGISNFDVKFLFKFKYTDEKIKRWCKVYSLIYNGRIKFDKDEILEIKFVPENILNKIMKTEKFRPSALEL